MHFTLTRTVECGTHCNCRKWIFMFWNGRARCHECSPVVQGCVCAVCMQWNCAQKKVKKKEKREREKNEQVRARGHLLMREWWQPRPRSHQLQLLFAASPFMGLTFLQIFNSMCSTVSALLVHCTLQCLLSPVSVASFRFLWLHCISVTRGYI